MTALPLTANLEDGSSSGKDSVLHNITSFILAKMGEMHTSVQKTQRSGVKISKQGCHTGTSKTNEQRRTYSVRRCGQRNLGDNFEQVSILPVTDVRYLSVHDHGVLLA